LRFCLVGNNNEDSNCTGDIQEIFDFIQIGEENIQTPPSSDVVIVVGLSGVGKSTLVQFIGNATNELSSECTRSGNCKIIDETGTIGDDLISKTFLPNLVVDVETNTSYFDMPGFNDNRNATVEIANSFFMTQVLNSSKRLKILILSTAASFNINQKSLIVSLMTNFVSLFKNPAKYVGSTAMISTVADAKSSHDERIWLVMDFLNNDLRPVLNELFDPISAPLVNETINAILISDTGHSDETKYLGYFVTPTLNGSLNEQQAFIDNHGNLTQITHENLHFTDSAPEDFGIPLSANALLLLERAHKCINEALKTLIQITSLEIRDTVMDNIQLIQSGDLSELEYTTDLMKNITLQDYSFADQKEQPVLFYVNKLEESLQNINTGIPDKAFEEIEKLGKMLDFIAKTSVQAETTPLEWVAPLKEIETNLQQQFNTIVEAIDKEVESFASSYSEHITLYIVNSYDQMSEGIETDAKTVEEFVATIGTSSFEIIDTPGNPPSDLCGQFIKLLQQFPLPELEETENKIEPLSLLLDLLFIANPSPVRHSAWVTKLKELKGQILTESQKYQRTLNETTINILQEFVANLTEAFNLEIAEVRNGSFENYESTSRMLSEFFGMNLKYLDELSNSPDYYYLTTVDRVRFFPTQQTKILTTKFPVFADLSRILTISLEGLILNTQIWKTIINESKDTVIQKQASYAEEVQAEVFEMYDDKLKQLADSKIHSFSLLDDIFDKEQKLNEFSATLIEATSSVNTSLSSNSFEAFVKQSGEIYSKLGSTNFTFNKMELLNIYDAISDFNWNPNKSWLEQMTTLLVNKIKAEKDTTDFLIAMASDLKLHAIQADLDMKDWWSRQNQDMTDTIFKALWDTYLYGKGNATRERSQTETWESFTMALDGKDRLKNLLNITLEKVKACGSDGAITNGFLRINDITECAKDKSSVTAFALSTLYIDESFNSSTTMKTGPVTVFFYTPNVYNPNNAINVIDLSGKDAVGTTNPLPPGEDAGVFYMLYDNIVSGSANGDISVEARGGSGATGVRGSNGEPGSTGGVESFSAESSDCAAYGGGEIRIRKDWWDCDVIQDGKCHAGNDGVWVSIYGKPGNPGNPGGPGGPGSNGGHGGSGFFDHIMFSTPIIKNGTIGKNGSPGAGGSGGVGGERGQTMRVKVDDVTGDNGKRCKELNRDYIAGRGDRGDTGSSGSSGQPNLFTPSLKSVDHVSARAKLPAYKDAILKFGDNEFFRRETKNFLDKLAQWEIKQNM